MASDTNGRGTGRHAHHTTHRAPTERTATPPQRKKQKHAIIGLPGRHKRGSSHLLYTGPFLAALGVWRSRAGSGACGVCVGPPSWWSSTAPCAMRTRASTSAPAARFASTPRCVAATVCCWRARSADVLCVLLWLAASCSVACFKAHKGTRSVCAHGARMYGHLTVPAVVVRM